MSASVDRNDDKLETRIYCGWVKQIPRLVRHSTRLRCNLDRSYGFAIFQIGFDVSLILDWSECAPALVIEMVTWST